MRGDLLQGAPEASRRMTNVEMRFDIQEVIGALESSYRRGKTEARL